MSAKKLRERMNLYIESANEEHLPGLLEVMKEYLESNQSTFRMSDGKVLTISEFRASLEKSWNDVKDGKGMSLEELSKASKLW